MTAKSIKLNAGLRARPGIYAKEKWIIFAMAAPFLLIAFVFQYLPLYGWIYAFFAYNPPKTMTLAQAPFIGLKHFRNLFTHPAYSKQFYNALKNTSVMGGLSILTSWLPLAFAIFLNDIRSSRFKKTIQTITTLPNFISWTLVFAIAYVIFSGNGLVNGLQKLLNDKHVVVNYLMNDNNTWLKMWMWQQWKWLGWNAIIYIAAISGIDQELYEAARVDGASRFRLIWHITVPGLIMTYLVVLMLNAANFLSTGLEQYLLFSNPFNSSSTGKIVTLDLFTYYKAFPVSGMSDFPFATTVGILKSIVGVALLFIINGISKLVRKESII